MNRIDVPMDGYERVIHVEDEASGLDAYIALHSTKLGPAVGGVRLHNYENSQQQLTDALRLSMGMTYKNAAAGLKHGGAKTTVNLAKIKDRKTAFQILGKAVNLLDGAYICAGDVGTTTEDLYRINDYTHYVAGIKLDSSKPTALGVYTSIEALLSYYNKSVSTSSFTIQGMGKVGSIVADILISRGGDVRAYDPSDAPFKKYTDNDAVITQLSEPYVYSNNADVFVPCALGGILNLKTLNTMPHKLIAGSANNQFATLDDVAIAHNLGFKYVPDFISSCGGVVAVALDFEKKRYENYIVYELRKHVLEILQEADFENVPAQLVAERHARRRLDR